MLTFDGVDGFLRGTFNSFVASLETLTHRAHLEAVVGYSISEYEYCVFATCVAGIVGLIVFVFSCRACRDEEGSRETNSKPDYRRSPVNAKETKTGTGTSDIQELQRILESRLNTLTVTTKEIDNQLDRLDELVEKRERDADTWQKWLPLVLSTCAFIIAFRRR